MRKKKLFHFIFNKIFLSATETYFYLLIKSLFLLVLYRLIEFFYFPIKSFFSTENGKLKMKFLNKKEKKEKSL